MAYTVQYVHSGSAVETYLAVDCTTGSTSITLNDATGWPSPTGSQVAYGKIKPGQTGESAFTYTSRSGNVLSGVTWNADGTTSTSYTAGSATVIRHGFTANEADEANAAVRNTLGRIDAAEQILVSDSSTTMAKLAVAASRFVGRKASGSIAALTAAEAIVVMGLGTAATKDTGYTASKIPVLTATPGTPDGTKFFRDDGTWAAAGSAFVGCRLKNTVAQTTANTTITVVTFDTEDLDTDAYHSTSSNTGRITIPTGKAGKYRIWGRVGWNANATGQRILNVVKNGTTNIVSHYLPGAAVSITHDFSDVFALAEADFIDIRVYQSSGGSLGIFGEDSDKGWTVFGCEYLGT